MTIKLGAAAIIETPNAITKDKSTTHLQYKININLNISW
jgi:hypothetical protein